VRVSHFYLCVPACCVCESVCIFTSIAKSSYNEKRQRIEKKESVYGVVLSLFQFNVRLVEFYAVVLGSFSYSYFFIFFRVYSLFKNTKNIHLHTQNKKLCGWENDYNICNSLQLMLQLPTVFFCAIFKLKSFRLLSLSTMMMTLWTDSI